MSEERKNTGGAEEMLSGLLRHSLRKPRGDAGECASADVIAAYFERSLSAAEMAQAETHFAVCTQCQEQLAAMARMETAMGAAAGAVTARASGFSFWNWRWVMPSAAAVVGAIAIWVVMRPEVVTQTGTVSERAAVREPAQSQPKIEPQVVATFPADAAAPAGAKVVAPGGKEEPAAGAGLSRKDAGRANEELRAAAQPPAVPVEGALGKSASKPDVQELRPPAEFAFADRAEKKKEAALAEADEMKRLAAAGASAERPAQTAEAQQKTAQQKSEVNDALRSRDVPRQNPQLAQAPAPAATDQMKAASTVTVESANVQTREAEAAKVQKQIQEAPPRQGEVGFRAQRSTAPRPKFSAGHGRVEWRFFESGIVQRYDERLKSGDAKELAEARDLLAASSPSEKICWAVGRNGLILRTIDTETWQRIGSPVDEDLISIEARSAEEATIRTRSGKVYVTGDGGKTWRTKE